jgi:uncharacterized protein (UPF0332 family)
VRPVTLAHLDKASLGLTKARAMLAAAATVPAMAEEAARCAYYAAYHAAKALVFEETGRSSKSHGRVQRHFFKLTQDETAVPRAIRVFLNSAYDFKAIADYDTASAGKITVADAGAAIATAEDFVATVRTRVSP